MQGIGASNGNGHWQSGLRSSEACTKWKKWEQFELRDVGR